MNQSNPQAMSDAPAFSAIRPLAKEIGISPNTLRKLLDQHGVKGRKVSEKLVLLHRATVWQVIESLPEKPLLGSGDAPDHLKRRFETLDA